MAVHYRWGDILKKRDFYLYLMGMIVLFGLLAIVIVEVISFVFWDKTTISIFAEELNRFNPLVGYCVSTLFGILIGHWFIPPQGRK